MAIAIGLLVITNLFTGYLLLGTHYRFKAFVHSKKRIHSADKR